MNKIRRFKFAKGRPLFKYSLLIVAFTVAVLIDGNYDDQRLAQASDFGVLSNTYSPTKFPEFKLISSITKLNKNEEQIVESFDQEKAENEISVLSVIDESNPQDIDENNDTDSKINFEEKALDVCSSTNDLPNTCITPTPTFTPTPAPTTTQTAPICGNNICEVNEYIPCPVGTECIWIGSCPQDCNYQPEPPKYPECGNNICEEGEADFENCPICDQESMCSLRPCIIKPGSCPSDCIVY
jgi:hypothetical protein